MNTYIGNLDFKVKENDLKGIFEEYGAVESVKIISDKFSVKSKGFGFVTMENDAEVQKAINELNGAALISREIVVNEAKTKNNIVNKLTSVIVLLFISLLSFAVSGPSVVRGKVVDAADGEAIAFAYVIITDMSDKVVANGVTDEDGAFEVSDISSSEVMIMVRMIGYEAFVSDRIVLSVEKNVDVGTLKMQKMSIGLQEITVVGEKNQIVYKIDRQSISASSSITATGGTVLDILANTPSVLVDGNGNMTYRGSSNFLVYVDGKISPLEGTAALKQIPSASVEDVEIITTPSARYRTDGDAAIINVTTKKMQTGGWSGLIDVSGSTIGTWSLNGMINYQKGRNNWYIGGTGQQIKGRSDFNQQKKTDVLGIETTSLSDGERWSSNGTTTAKAGWQ